MQISKGIRAGWVLIALLCTGVLGSPDPHQKQQPIVRKEW